MALSLAGSLNQLDVYRIVHDFDRDHFKTAKPLRKDQVDRIVVIIQFEKLLFSQLPIELVDEIMRRCLDNSPSVGTLMMYYKNTRAIVLVHPLPLSDVHFINDASKSLLVRLKQTPSKGSLVSYPQLMISVFRHHFQTLTLDQRLELIRRSHITPWEEKSTSEKLELLGRIQAPTLWGTAKVRLQFLSWKVQFAAAWALEKNIILWAVLGTALALALSGLSLWIAGCSSFVASTVIYQTLVDVHAKAYMYVIISAFAALVASLVLAGLGLALQTRIFPTSIQEKGAWLKSVNWNCFLIAFHLLLIILPSNKSQNSNNNNSEGIFKASHELQRLLLQSINEANLTLEQQTFVDAQLPDLTNKWLQLTNP